MKLLIIEDDQDLVRNLRKGLSEEGYVVDTAFTGTAGQELAESFNFDIIILDLGLPDKDGIEVCRSLRQKKINAKILALTGRNSIADRIKGLDCGADDYLGKPFDFEELCARLRALVRREPIVIPNRITVGNLVLDTVTRQVWKKKKPVDLSPKEFLILEHLMRHPDQIISRSMLEQRIWNTTFEIGSNLLDVFISKLRAKLEDTGPDNIIQTIRNRGYRINSHAIL